MKNDRALDECFEKLGRSCPPDRRGDWYPQHRKPPTIFSDLDLGGMPDRECYVGLQVMREIHHQINDGGEVFSQITSIEIPRERNSFGTSDEEVHKRFGLTIDSIRFQLCQN